MTRMVAIECARLIGSLDAPCLPMLCLDTLTFSQKPTRNNVFNFGSLETMLESMDASDKQQANSEPEMVPVGATEGRTEAGAVAPVSGHPAGPAGDPGAPSGPVESRPRGRPKGSKNRATVNGRLFYGKHARKVVPKLVKRAIDEIEKADGNLDFAEKVGRLAAAYAFGKPVETQEVSGPEGAPITSELLPMERVQRLAALFVGFQPQGQPVDETPAKPNGEDHAAG